MRVSKLPASVSGKVVGLALIAGVGSASYFIYQRVVLGNPMRMGFDAEGVWSPISRQQHLTEKVEELRAKVAEKPDSDWTKYRLATYMQLLERELQKNPQKP